ncbi:hypothetical protein BCCR75502_04438 [Burkholderia sola]|nr:hypothetical protein BCCR75389_04418 [Burkholderia cenocepacia]CAG2327306.1 hypothetical protein BCCR75388_04437 [Burkholderia cenocepacia]CAG2327318.1 hypothetical protein BCCR75384_04436 [Burkholderia cenocepacia]CAG2327324.1 hypothetical protein BCCR75386_04435 [Burkholderia cenocepacia]CAG2327370.1 hypothetical protein BCCR75387_04436 [Burkholderia cenocepacia]
MQHKQRILAYSSTVVGSSAQRGGRGNETVNCQTVVVPAIACVEREDGA